VHVCVRYERDRECGYFDSARARCWVFLYLYIPWCEGNRVNGYGVASVSRIDKIIGLFCKRTL